MQVEWQTVKTLISWLQEQSGLDLKALPRPVCFKTLDYYDNNIKQLSTVQMQICIEMLIKQIACHAKLLMKMPQE